MSQLEPTLDLPLAVPPRRIRGRIRVPGWMVLMLENRKSQIGLAMVGFVILIAIIAPWISVAHPNDFSLFDARQSPSWHHLFGTTDQGSDIFSQVVIGARRSLLLGAAAGAIATVLATVLGVFAAYMGGIVDDILNLVTNVFFVIPTIPLLIDVTAFLHTRGLVTMILVIALTLWAFEARILRGQALTLKNRDFVLAAKAAPDLVLDTRLVGVRRDDLDLDLDEIEIALAPSFLKVRVRDVSKPALTEGPLPSPDTIAGAFIRDLEAHVAELEAGGFTGEAAEQRDALRLGRLLLAGHEVSL
jgi:hypothetical protein